MELRCTDCEVPEVMTIKELAEYLQLPDPVLYQLVSEGRLPGKTVEKHGQFQRSAIDLWHHTPVENYHLQKQNLGTRVATGLIETFDIDEHAALVSPFETQRTQISVGRFYSRLSYVKMPGMVIYEDCWLRQATSYGTSPENLIMLIANVGWQRSRMYWCGRKIDHRRFGCSLPGSEINFSAGDNSHYLILLLEPKLLARTLGPETVDLLFRRKHVECSAVDGKRLIAILSLAIRICKTHSGLLEDPLEYRMVQSRVFESLSNCFARGESNNRLEKVSFRDIAVRRAIECMNQSSKPITALELAVASGASQRTLEQGFREVFGVTPGACLRAHRMNRAHHALSVADQHLTTVAYIARENGFLHPGRFSIAYRKLFGVRPFSVLHKPPPSTLSSPLVPPCWTD